MWVAYKKGFKAWLRLEKSLSAHSVDAYLHDIEKLTQFIQLQGWMYTPDQLNMEHLQQFIRWIAELGMTQTSQARILSGLRSFYSYCQAEQLTKEDPTILLESPKLKRTLPDTLSYEEIELLIGAIDRSKPEGERNKAIL